MARIIRLKKTDQDYDPRNRFEAIKMLEAAEREQTFMTGLIYYEEPRMTLAESENLVDASLVHLPQETLRPSREALDSVMQSLM